MNLYRIRPDRGPGGDLFRSAQKQAPNYQGLWILDTAGKVIGTHQNFKSHETWPREVLEDLERVLQAFGPVEARSVKAVDPLPHRGKGFQPDGQAALAVYSSVLYGGKRLSPPIVDSILFSADDVQAFRPPQAKPGAEWTVRESAARKFSRAISGSNDATTMPHPEDVTSVELKARVESVEGKLVRIRLRGTWEATRVNPNDAQKRPSYTSSKGEGTVLFDAEKNEMQSMLVLFEGTWRMVKPYDDPKPVAGMVEWTR